VFILSFSHYSCITISGRNPPLGAGGTFEGRSPTSGANVTVEWRRSTSSDLSHFETSMSFGLDSELHIRGAIVTFGGLRTFVVISHNHESPSFVSCPVSVTKY